MDRIITKNLHDHIDEQVILKGWVDTRRDHGKLIFFDLRDRGGKVQAVVLPDHQEPHEAMQDIRDEYVVSVEGKVNERPEKMVNEDEDNGDIEIEVTGLEVLNESNTPPFQISGGADTAIVDESTRLQYRYLDLRSERMQENIRWRHMFVREARQFLEEQDFVEIETPLLTKSTPEGSRDFVVPSRLHKGKFYALPQSPQQYKQLLMTAGFERYFQLARAVRDEDLRADRGFEHTQIDIEMSFVSREDILNLIENMITHSVEALGFTIKDKPFPRISYREAMDKHGDDKFDLRTEAEKEEGILAYAWVIDFPMFEKVNQEEATGKEKGEWTFSHNPFSAPMPDSLDDLLAGKNIENIISAQYDLVCNGYESGGGSIRSHKPEWLEATYKIMGYNKEEIQESVGHMMEAFGYGTPPHGGIALGVERNAMNLTGEEQLRDVQAFPQTRTGKTAVMDAPAPISKKQLKELGLKIVKSEDKQ